MIKFQSIDPSELAHATGGLTSGGIQRLRGLLMGSGTALMAQGLTQTEDPKLTPPPSRCFGRFVQQGSMLDRWFCPAAQPTQ